jgi:methylated-DNA-[protein]-cysteine S-methyltransferase
MNIPSITPFQSRVYTLLTKVPKGKVTTYMELAKALGIKSPRAIGQALKNNPFAPEVPCHRVVASDGTIGGFMGQKEGLEIKKKMNLLESEGITIDGNHIRDFEKILYHFS